MKGKDIPRIHYEQFKKMDPLSMGFSRQEYWGGLPFPSPGDLPDPGIKPMPPVSPAFAGKFFTSEPPGKPLKRMELSSKVGKL